jgi:hypothetical protein
MLQSSRLAGYIFVDTYVHSNQVQAKRNILADPKCRIVGSMWNDLAPVSGPVVMQFTGLTPGKQWAAQDGRRLWWCQNVFVCNIGVQMNRPWARTPP